MVKQRINAARRWDGQARIGDDAAEGTKWWERLGRQRGHEQSRMTLPDRPSQKARGDRSGEAEGKGIE